MKDFEVVKKIGQGSYGTVYKVKRKRDGQMLVIKQIEMGKATRKDQKEAENEVQILKSLKHSYGTLLRWYSYFIAGDLGKVIKLNHGGLEEKRVWKYLLQMLFGLRYIHSRKVLHRDMKTINVFLTENDEVRIGDLGVAKIAQDQSMFAQTIVGTPYYLSPELCEERPYNEKSDVWALGCIVYELCTKNHPFKATNQGALALKIIKGMYSPIPSTYSADLSQAIGLMLTKDYWKRPTTGQLLGMASMFI